MPCVRVCYLDYHRAVPRLELILLYYTTRTGLIQPDRPKPASGRDKRGFYRQPGRIIGPGPNIFPPSKPVIWFDFL
jgi:hypothetical protein